MKSYYLETFGCQMNVVDSERIATLLQGIGYQPVTAPEVADLVLLNTCSVRDKAERKVYGHLGRFKPLKARNPSLIVGVGGCVAQQEGEELLRKIPHLDLVFGTHNVHKLPEMVRRAEEGRGRSLETDFLDRETRLALFPERSEGEGVTRFVTVMQGCDNFCTYCIVPHVRGREISRPAIDITGEVRELAAQGVKEVTLIGQNVNSYGRKEGWKLTFASLLEEIHAIPGIERIRFTTSHPRDFSEDMVAAYGRLPKLALHLHLPVQSGADRILAAMERGYTRVHYLETVRRLRQVAPQIRFTTDIIVGFPGETEEDFQQTLDLVEQVRFADLYSFLYSPRPGTAAATYPGQIVPAIRQERFDRLLALQEGISRDTWGADIGQTYPVLVEGESRQGGQLFGRTTWNRIVNFPGDQSLIGSLVPVRITTAYRNSQLGERVQE